MDFLKPEIDVLINAVVPIEKIARCLERYVEEIPDEINEARCEELVGFIYEMAGYEMPDVHFFNSREEAIEVIIAELKRQGNEFQDIRPLTAPDGSPFMVDMIEIATTAKVFNVTNNIGATKFERLIRCMGCIEMYTFDTNCYICKIDINEVWNGVRKLYEFNLN